MNKQKLTLIFASMLTLGTKLNAGIFDKIISWWNQKPMTLHQQRRLAFVSALHPRLGSDSPAHRLPRELFRQICEFVESDRVAFWREKSMRERKWGLVEAIQSGNEASVRAILSAGIDNFRSPSSWTVAPDPFLIIDIRFNQGNFVHLLLEANADPTACAEKRITPLHEAVWHDQPQSASLLLQAGAKVNACWKYRQTPLDSAERRPGRPCVQLLLNAGGHPAPPPLPDEFDMDVY